MPAYVVKSDSPIQVREIEGGGTPEHPWVPPSRPELPPLPPRDEWPPLPPWLQPGVGLPIPPTVELPMVPVPPGDGDEEVGIWPPVKPELPDLSGKTLALALIYVSRHVARWHWIVIDNEAAKERFKELVGKLPKPEHPIAPGAQPKRS